jgi:hypothetical protein
MLSHSPSVLWKEEIRERVCVCSWLNTVLAHLLISHMWSISYLRGSKYIILSCGNLAQGDGLITTLATSIAVADARTKARLSYAPVGNSIRHSSESVVFQPTTSALNHKQAIIDVGEVSVHRYLPPIK